MDTGLAGSIAASVAAHREEMVAFTEELVAIPTENPPGVTYQACVAALATRLRMLDFEPAVIEVPPDPERGTDLGERGRGEERGDPSPRSCVLAFLGSGARTLYFHGHYDVVPASSAAQFEPYLEGGRLFGRGTADMKGGLAAMIYAAVALREAGARLDGRIGLALVPDEETGGRRGSHALAAMGLLGRGGIGMLTPEPTGGVIWHASRGAITLRITVLGKPAHVGLHYQGINAFEGMLVVAGALQGLKAEVEGRVSGCTIEPEAARHSILMLGGRCEGGTGFNVVPAACSFTVERRINPEEDLHTEKARLFALLDRVRREGIDLEVEVIQEAPASASPGDGPLAVALAESVATVTGRSPAFEMCPGLLEIRFYAQQGMPAYAYGPGLLSVAHGPEEYVDVEGITGCAAIYALTALAALDA